MFIREIEKQNPNSQKVFISHRLVQSIRMLRGPRHNVVMNLGKLYMPKDKWKQLTNRIEEILHGQDIRLIEVSEKIEALARHYAKLLIKKRFSENSQDQSTEQLHDFQCSDINGLCSFKNKSIGPEHVGWRAMKRLGFFDLFQQLGFTQSQSA